MNLVILHHHLNRGGVTQVIANHLRSLATLPAPQQPRRVIIVYDGQRDGWRDDVPGEGAQFCCEFLTVPAVGYDIADGPADSAALAETVETALASAGVAASEALLHVHNHSLGKNASLPGALTTLAERGWPQLLQVHDFAEDNRPANYRRLADALDAPDPQRLGGLLYPQAERIHYATLTRRDAVVLGKAGVAGERLEPLANPVAEFGDLPAVADARARVLAKLSLPANARLFAYPVRGIRRKNLGEMLLLAAIAPADAYLAVTLAPKNPVEYASFDAWSEMARRLELRCRFDTAGQAGVAFHDMLAAADALLTTSVAEGFGMVFLEAWLAGRMLVGRNLPEITADFRDEGVEFEGLYDQLSVPLTLVDEAAVRSDLRAVNNETCKRYGIQPLSLREFDRHVEPLFAGGCVDFGRFTPERQADLIERAAHDAAVRDGLLAANESVARLLAIRHGNHEALIHSNAAVVRSRYSTRAVGKRLLADYERVLRSPAGGPARPAPNGRAVLDHFVTPEHILPVRVA